jgi:hypothetical protein
MDLFVGKSNDWLLEQLSIAQDDYAQGKTLSSYSSGDSSGSEFVVMSPRQRIHQILIALKDRGITQINGQEIGTIPADKTRPRFV